MLSKDISLEISPGPSIDLLTIPVNDREHCSNRKLAFKGKSSLTNELVKAQPYKTLVFAENKPQESR